MSNNTVRLSENTETAIRHDWTRPEVEALFRLPFNDLLFRAQGVHRLSRGLQILSTERAP
jgi:biotin synthase-like enzyme